MAMKEQKVISKSFLNKQSETKVFLNVEWQDAMKSEDLKGYIRFNRSNVNNTLQWRLALWQWPDGFFHALFSLSPKNQNFLIFFSLKFQNFKYAFKKLHQSSLNVKKHKL